MMNEETQRHMNSLMEIHRKYEEEIAGLKEEVHEKDGSIIDLTDGRLKAETEISKLREALKEALIEIEAQIIHDYGDDERNKGTSRDFRHVWADEISLIKEEE